MGMSICLVLGQPPALPGQQTQEQAEQPCSPLGPWQEKNSGAAKVLNN